MREMPPLPGQENEQMRIEELNRKIAMLTQEIDALAIRLRDESGVDKKLSRGDDLPDQESMMTGEEESLFSRRRRRTQETSISGKALERELSRKMQERAGLILERDGILPGKTK